VISLADVPRFCVGEIRISSMLWRGFGLLLSRKKKHDIVHIHGPVPTFSDLSLLLTALGRKARHLKTKAPLIVYTHHSEIDLPGCRQLCDVYNRGHKLLARLADQVIVETPAYARRLTEYVPSERVSVVPCGTDQWQPHAELPKAERFSVLFVGQLRPYKGLETLLAAAAGLDGTELHIVGSGHRERHYRNLAAAPGLEHVTFHGRLSEDELQRRYAEAHVLVLPSNTKAEAFGLVLLEGMIAGCVPVASQLPGVMDVVGNVGLTFPVDDEIALRESLRRLRDDGELRRSLALRARERGRTFTWPRMVHWHRAVYERLLALRRFDQALRGSHLQSALRRLIADSLPAIGASAGYIKISTGGTASQTVEASVELSEEPGDKSSSLAVPIAVHRGLLGVLTVSRDTDRQFSDYEIQWLTSLAQRLGSALVRGGYVPGGHLPTDLDPPPPPDRQHQQAVWREDVWPNVA
ncbi:MAG: glycosyltransferase, partial [Chloroflexota bacterium]